MKIIPWLKANLSSVGALTGTDKRALDAAVAIMELYACEPHQRLLTAFGAVVESMQPTTRQFAYHGIAMVLDWSDRERLWAAAGLPRIEKPWRCQHEPKINGHAGNLKVALEGRP